jgi:predicted anti-sigma-YlaC factor YlaD
MAHYTKEQLESYRNGNTSVLGRIICGIHLKNCEECSKLLDELAEEDKLIDELQNSIEVFQNITEDTASVSKSN